MYYVFSIFPYIFFYFEKRKQGKKTLIFREAVFFYIQEKVHSEPWYIQKSDIFRTRSIFRILVHCVPETYLEHCQRFTMEHSAKIAT